MATQEYKLEFDDPSNLFPQQKIYDNQKVVVLSDWDGTITNMDSNDWMTDNIGYNPYWVEGQTVDAETTAKGGVEGRSRRIEENVIILRQKETAALAGGEAEIRQEHTFNFLFKKMMDSVAKKIPLEECAQLLRANIKLDTGFTQFYNWCEQSGVPVVIVSSGMKPTIRAVLSNLVKPEQVAQIQIISNNVVKCDKEKDGQHWRIVYIHDNENYSSADGKIHGHDKSQAILPYVSRDKATRPTLFFFGDGVSDMSAAKHADVLFVKLNEGTHNDLMRFCRQEGIHHIRVRSFAEALPVVQRVKACGEDDARREATARVEVAKAMIGQSVEDVQVGIAEAEEASKAGDKEAVGRAMGVVKRAEEALEKAKATLEESVKVLLESARKGVEV
ncbi:HAD-like protein [Coniophora puteana RWD-64-598 SS2]|uniref:HAD-like protein n=1 Tax=Coniophora puteana (strain RWD-64-598) TaxID=741705 RepID=A0A5M3MHQ8_CONPW|nr:HAD-like protein [Coniophora puteana RWD-64-598 SS2]EIW78175.1 HAD-like protein [Coniophora puteana RWD-64-598 SS2]